MAVADHPTWALAAASVGVSPSALSQGLAELERRIGVTMFERDGRRRLVRGSVTPVVDHARQVLALTGDLVDWASRIRTATAGSVRVGMVDIAAVVRYPSVIADFRRSRPDVDLRLVVAPSRSLLEALRAGELDVVVCVEPSTAIVGVRTEPLCVESLVVVAPAGSNLDDRRNWGPWLLFPVGSHTRAQVDEALRRDLGTAVHVAAESHQPDVLARMVEFGLGWTVLPAEQIPHDVSVELGPQLLDRRLVVARRDGAVSDPVAGEFIDRLVRAATVDAVARKPADG